MFVSGDRCVVESRSQPADPRRRGPVPNYSGKAKEKDISVLQPWEELLCPLAIDNKFRLFHIRNMYVTIWNFCS